MKWIWALLKGIMILAAIMLASVVIWVIFEEFPLLGTWMLIVAVSVAIVYAGIIVGSNLFKLFKDWWHDKPPGMA